MSYPGIVLAVMAVVAVGTVIYNLVTGERQRPLHYHDGPDQDYDYVLTPPRTLTPARRMNRKRKTDDLCSICLGDMTANLKTLDCGHRFHTHCITKWFNIQTSCPNCRNRERQQ